MVHEFATTRGCFPSTIDMKAISGWPFRRTRFRRETGLGHVEFPLATPGAPHTSPESRRGDIPARGRVRSRFDLGWFGGHLLVVSVLSTNPTFQPRGGGKTGTASGLVERLHAGWPISREYMAPADAGNLVALDPALLVTRLRDWKWDSSPSSPLNPRAMNRASTRYGGSSSSAGLC